MSVVSSRLHAAARAEDMYKMCTLTRIGVVIGKRKCPRRVAVCVVARAV